MRVQYRMQSSRDKSARAVGAATQIGPEESAPTVAINTQHSTCDYMFSYNFTRAQVPRETYSLITIAGLFLTTREETYNHTWMVTVLPVVGLR